MKILNFGSCNLDYVYSLEHIVMKGETESSAKMEIFAGGKGLNQSIAVAKAGVQIFHTGCVGSDGGLLADTLKLHGVNTEYLQEVPEKNGHAIIQVTKDGENSIILYAGSNAMISEKLIDRVLEDFESGDILLLQNEINNIPLIVEKAYSRGMKIVLNPSPYNEKIHLIDMSKISCMILNEVEAAGLSGTEDVQQSMDYLCRTYPQMAIMMTLGKKGCVYGSGEERLHQKAFSVQAVDTTAAGDTFTGYFIAGLSQNKKIADILVVASAAAAIAVTRNGAAPSIPAIEEVICYLTENGCRPAEY